MMFPVDDGEKPLPHVSHGRPINRRDALTQAAGGFAALSLLPQRFGFGTSTAFGAEVECAGQVSGLTPFMVFDMAGGAALPANFLVGRPSAKDIDLLPSYDRLGWDPRKDKIDQSLGIPMASELSGLYLGIVSATSPQARANFRMGSFCHIAQDDTTSNRLSAMSLVSQYGVRGMFITNSMGIRNSKSGGNSDVALQDDTLKPAFISSVGDILGAVSYGGAALKPLRKEAVKALAESGLEISRLQLRALMERPNGKMLHQLMECGYRKNIELVNGATGVDPRSDPVFQQVYGINANTAVGDVNAVAAGLSMNSLKGFSGPSCWTLLDCDYHDGTSTKGDRLDREMGVQIGRAVEAAFRLKRPLFFQLITDGGCSNAVGTRKWTSDSGDKCMSVIGYFHPTKVPEMERVQVGHYTDGQGAAQNTLVGGSPIRAAYAAFANYLNIHKKLGDFQRLVPGVFTDEELRQILIFKEMA